MDFYMDDRLIQKDSMEDFMSEDRDELLEKVIDHVGFLMNSLNPEDELNKMIAMQMTFDPDLHNHDFIDVMTRVIFKLAEFYDDIELQNLWTEYLLHNEDEDDLDYEDAA